ncbi:MAG: hypothetical protein R3260_18195, partial [Pseudomonas sp.]|nr:hypothetical protein [Pseudomonas sp.]
MPRSQLHNRSGSPAKGLVCTAEDVAQALLFAGCDCLIHSRAFERTGLPVLQAMASALPVVVLRSGDESPRSEADLEIALAPA